MMKKEEKVLLYNFKDKDEFTALKSLLENMKINVISVDKTAYQQKVGYLFGLKGFSENRSEEGDFAFNYELMMFHNFTKSRLDAVLKKMREQNLKVPVCKAVVTSFNRFWTLRRVCEAMEKEHLSMRKDER